MNFEIEAKHIFWLIILSIAWGANYLFVKIAVDSLPPLIMMSIRGISASLFLLLVLLIKKPAIKIHLSNKKLQSICFICGALIAYMWYTMAVAETHLTASMTSLLIVVSPIFAWLIATFIYREKPFYMMNLIGIIIAIFGLVFMIGIHQLLHGHNDLFYIVFYITGLFGFVVSAALSSHNTRKISAMIVVCFTTFYTTIILVIAALLFNHSHSEFPINAVLAACGTGVISTGCGYLIYFWLVAHAGQVFAASNGYLVPISGFALGVILLNEPAFWHQVIGLLIVFVGTYLTNKRIKS